MLELQAPRDGLASGVVIESSLEKGRGAVATVLVKQRHAANAATPSSRAPSSAACARCSTRTASRCRRPPPSMPVRGARACPARRMPATICWRSRASARRAKSRCTARASSATSSSRARARRSRGRVLADGRGARPASSLCCIKADVQGSAEALREALDQALHRGGAGQGDRAAASAASPSRTCSWRRPRRRCIIGFNVRADAGARDAIEGDRRRGALLQHHLRSHRRGEAEMSRPAAAGDQGDDRRHGAGARGVPLAASSASSPAAW